jgi:hypothetical protein
LEENKIKYVTGNARKTNQSPKDKEGKLVPETK